MIVTLEINMYFISCINCCLICLPTSYKHFTFEFTLKQRPWLFYHSLPWWGCHAWPIQPLKLEERSPSNLHCSWLWNQPRLLWSNCMEHDWSLGEQKWKSIIFVPLPSGIVLKGFVTCHVWLQAIVYLSCCLWSVICIISSFYSYFNFVRIYSTI